ncbi:SpaH/EbpB family LPXTG-anchored major pilin [Pseudactinotalea sp. HY160]|nr:SpaH/EbpB family LPXTG-anchored major pilin [Pseudactinotalea sp. HY160]
MTTTTQDVRPRNRRGTYIDWSRRDMTIQTTGGRLRGIAAATGAMALGAMGMVALAAPASAAIPNFPDGPYSVTVHKYAQPDDATGLPNDGTEITTGLTGLEALDGVTYTIAEVSGIDLTTAAGWQLTEHLSVDATGAVVDDATPATIYTTSVVDTQVTAAGGVAAFTGLDLGVYLVSETDAGANNITQLADPFLVTVPFPNENAWLTDVHVYPKNPVTDITKEVDDSGAHGLGDTVVWPITAGVPNIPDGQSLDSFEITDDLDTRLDYQSATVTLTAADDTTDVPLATGDYTLVNTGQNVTLEFTTAGIAVLAANQGGTVTLTIDTTVNSVGDGTIANAGILYVNDSDHDHGFESETPKTTWGSINLLKTDAADPGNPLEGAEFQVYLTEADAAAGTNPVSVGGVTTFVSDASGAVTIEGLKSQENGTGANLTYYVVETQAPAGYTIAADYSAAESGVAFTVLPGTTTNATVTVENPQVPPFELPLTGSSGTALFIGGGLALIALAIGAAIVIGRRKSHAGSNL